MSCLEVHALGIEVHCGACPISARCTSQVHVPAGSAWRPGSQVSAPYLKRPEVIVEHLPVGAIEHAGIVQHIVGCGGGLLQEIKLIGQGWGHAAKGEGCSCASLSRATSSQTDAYETIVQGCSHAGKDALALPSHA